MADGRQGMRFHALDSLRGICALTVALYHLRTPGLISGSAVVQNGFLFVDFFFVLSGFVIAASYGERLARGFSIARFMGLRLGRVYPLHLVMLLAFVGFELVFAAGLLGTADRQAFSPPNDWASFAASLLLIHPFVGPDSTFWNGPSWSIAVEVWTYFAFALLFRLAGRMLVPIALAVALGSALFLGWRTDRFLEVFHDGALARCLYGFALGVVAYRAHVRFGGRPLGRWATLLEMAAVAAVCLLVVAAGPTPLSLAVPPVFFLAVLLFAQEGGAVSRLLTTRPLLLLGTLSYGIYMVHLFLAYRVVNALALIEKAGRGRWSLVARTAEGNQVGGSALLGDLMSVGFVALVIAVAWVAHVIVERPGQRWSRRLLLGSSPSTPARVAEAEVPTF